MPGLVAAGLRSEAPRSQAPSHASDDAEQSKQPIAPGAVTFHRAASGRGATATAGESEYLAFM
jgi:hypothetical protein